MSFSVSALKFPFGAPLMFLNYGVSRIRACRCRSDRDLFLATYRTRCPRTSKKPKKKKNAHLEMVTPERIILLHDY